MPEQTKLIRGTLVLTLGRVAGYGLAFLRNLLLARLLSKADYGLSAVFSMAMMMLELNSRMSFSTQIIQSDQGNSNSFQSSAHALQFIGGLVSALLIAACCVPMAKLFGVPHTIWAFAALSIVPLSQGLTHLDISRRQRHMEFLPLVLIDVLPQLLTTLAIWPLVLWLKDYRVIVWVMIGKSVLGVLISFALSQRPYTWAWDQKHIRSMLQFGWPLLLTGLVMFGAQQADQFLVGAAFSLPILANYALALSLVNTPWFVLGQVLSSLTTPLMSLAQNDPIRLLRQYKICAKISAVGGILMMFPLIVAGEQIIVLFYGPKYEGTGPFMAVLGAAAAVRFLRFAPASVALAKGDTISQLYANLWRGASLPLALIAWQLGGSPLLIASCALTGELLSTLASLYMLQRRQGVPFHVSFGACGYQTLFVGLALLTTFSGVIYHRVWLATAIAVCGFVLALGTAWLAFPDMATYIITTLRKKPHQQ